MTLPREKVSPTSTLLLLAILPGDDAGYFAG